MSEEKKIKEKSLIRYFRDIPQLLLFSTLASIILALFTWGYQSVVGSLLWSADVSALTSANLPFLWRSWQGWIVMILGLIFLVIYTVLEINVMILLSRKVLYDEDKKFGTILKEAVMAGKNMLNVRGVLIVLFVAYLIPLTGAAVGISLTDSFVIPDFILSVIRKVWWQNLLYLIVLAVLYYVAVEHIFVFHYIVLKDMKPKEALAASKKLFRGNWKSIVVRYVRFVLRTLLVYILLGILTIMIPLVVVNVIDLSVMQYRWGLLMILAISGMIFGLAVSLFAQFQFMRLTEIFDSYEYDISLMKPKAKHRKVLPLLLVTCYCVLAVLISALLAQTFDEVFPDTAQVRIIAHRGAGNESSENTLEAVEKAISYHTYGSEIDIQRTADGYYIINHDATFGRLTGVNKKPSELTLAECKELNITGPDGEVVHPAELGELLDVIKDSGTKLYIELKGETADRQMADDAYQMVMDRDMLKDVAFISLEYDVLDYLETKHPEAETILLCFYSFGEIENLNVDGYGLEAEAATPENVDKIHSVGKTVDVWTCNERNVIIKFTLSEADGIITDEVTQSIEVLNNLQQQPDLYRILGKLFPDLVPA